MSFLSRLFKKNEPETLEHKITKVELQPQDQLLNTALQSDEEQLRAVAIAKLNYSPELIKIATSNQHTKQIVNIARKRIGELLDNASISIESLSNDVGDQITLLSLCGYSSKTGTSLIEQLSDESILLDVAQVGTTTQIRQAAAAKIDSRKGLTDLLKTAKNKDKAVFKIAKSKLDVFKQADEKQSELDSKIDTICKQLEQLSKRDVDDIFHARKKQIEESWSLLSEQANNQAIERYQTAASCCQLKLDDIAKAEQALIEQEAADKEAKKELLSSLANMQELLSQLYSHDNPTELESDIKKAQELQSSALKEASGRGLNIQKEARLAENLTQSLQALLEKLKAIDPLPDLLNKLQQTSDESGKALIKQIEPLLIYSKYLTDTPLPEIVTSSRSIISDWNKSFKLQADKSKEKLKEVSELIRRANWAVSKGYVGRARAIFRDLEEKIQQLEHTPNHIESKFDDVKTSMSKLGDWHEFAVTPKKEALVEEMQSLLNSTLHPKDLADKIHSLQDSWKELCKGGQNQDEELWSQFQNASQTAYERCKIYFDEQSKIRAANAELRLTLLTHLEQYETEYNWNNANWKEVENTLKTSRETWQSYWPIPRKQIKELQERFDGILDRIFELRNSEFDANKVKKQDIVEQSSALCESEDIQSSIESAKKLQAQWKTIGRCKRKDDQVLWKTFRENCDSIFEKRNQENEAQKEERNAAKCLAEEIIAQLSVILNCESKDFFEARNQCSSLSEQFQNIGELPRDQARTIADNYQKTLAAIESRVIEERKNAAAKQWISAFTIADKIRSYELKCLQNEDCTEYKNEIEKAISDVVKWPANTLSALQHRLDNASHLASSTSTTSTELLRILCIRSEILSDNDTPDEEKAYRMTYQVNQLKDGFGKANSNSQKSINEILNEWMHAPATPDEQYAILLKRFAKCWKLEL